MSIFDEYIKGGNPSQREKSYAWKTAIGLQDVDGLKSSEYLVQTAKQNIEGDITIDEVKQLLDSYYESKNARGEVEERTEEADKVSARITEILTEKTFNFFTRSARRIQGLLPCLPSSTSGVSVSKWITKPLHRIPGISGMRWSERTM